MICVPITETDAARFLAAIDEALPLADAIELRLDYLSDIDVKAVLAVIGKWTPFPSHTLIFTFRPREQGGQRDLSLAERDSFWSSFSTELLKDSNFADLEIDLVERYVINGSPIPWDRVICSYHDFERTPGNLDRVFYRLKRTPARVVKVATLANHPADCVQHFDLIERSGMRHERSVIALAMGLPGIATRILAVSRGAMLTFGALHAGAESASGQPSVTELTDLYHIRSLTRESEIYGVIGYPVGHSLSPQMHNVKMTDAGRNAVYLPFEVASDLERFVREMVHPKTRRLDWNIRGLSVTIPHKIEIMRYLDEVDAVARSVGAVNTVVVGESGLKGFNTDVAGAMKPLDAMFNVRGARIAVLGYGGAARAICHGLATRGAVVKLYGRDLEKGRALGKELNLPVAPLFSFAGFADVVINCTPLGMEGHSRDRSPVPRWSLQGVKLVYDLVYNPTETRLLQEAREAGCITLGGMAMLRAQAAEQYRLWTGETMEY